MNEDVHPKQEEGTKLHKIKSEIEKHELRFKAVNKKLKKCFM